MFQSYYMVTIAGKINYCWEDVEITCRLPLIYFKCGIFPLHFLLTSLQKCLFSYIRIWPEESYWLANTFSDKDLSWYCMVSPPVHSHLFEIKITPSSDCYFCVLHWVWLHWTWLSEKPMMWLYQEHHVSWTVTLKRTVRWIWGISKSMYTPSYDVR